MSQATEVVLQRLLQVARDLYAETADLSEAESELQRWYNRGYADGMVSAIKALGFTQQADGIVIAADSALVAGQELLPWGKAYRHGFEMGERETVEVLQEKQS
ncbi:MAG: hypothetical protein KZQ99_21290 [Candidatus Thiodiazotropha sp. (ex Dulcina madagascariensis)]|nr:hypothetical protein [Candidatus Thiodiazotropha sp. (ex Epidulcina cf. delphinae)]MCU7937359.1 hypothetical protein [Candidatus Thiodiazotropha sp. (ex Dulcina madagascariensis)]